MPELGTNYYIAALDLRGKRALVVGAGAVALEKIENLLLCHAEVRVVAPEAASEIAALARSGAIEWHERTYQMLDLDGCFLAIAATSDTEVNVRVHRDAESVPMLVNVADVPELCNFILPAIARVGPIAVAISTAGASPALAKRMKREAAELFGPEYATLAGLLNEIRDWAKTTLPTYLDRRDFFEAIVNGDSDPIELMRLKGADAVRDLIADAQARVKR